MAVVNQSSGRRIGRPSKGDRDVFYTRMPRPVGDLIRTMSEETGVAISDIIAGLAARGLGMEQYAPALPDVFDEHQQELPLKSA
jgi:hypothetical protein